MKNVNSRHSAVFASTSKVMGSWLLLVLFFNPFIPTKALAFAAKAHYASENTSSFEDQEVTDHQISHLFKVNQKSVEGAEKDDKVDDEENIISYLYQCKHLKGGYLTACHCYFALKVVKLYLLFCSLRIHLV